MSCIRLRHALLAVLCVASILCHGRDYASYVDPFIGTEGDGNTFPGATMPFGMVKLGPDCGDRSSNPGYRAGATVRGFSHLHVSGTDGGPKYGNILVFPFTGELTVTDYGSGSTAEHAEPGYFPFTPHSHGSWPNFFYETNSWEYSFYVPHDVSRLIEKCGGSDSFVSRLDRFFDSGYFNINNEPGFLIPCLYLWAGRHDRTVERVNRLLSDHFGDGRDGLPGNDDSGAMSAWYVFHNIGFFPNAGQNVYLLTAPRFKRTQIDLGNGRTLTVEADNLSPDNIYVESVTIDGKPWHKSWFSHADIARGATIRFRMSPRPGKWERTAEAPPSRS